MLVRAGCTYPFPELLLDLVLSEHVLVDLFAHDEVEKRKGKEMCGGRGRGSGKGKGKAKGVSVGAGLFRQQMRCVRAHARVLVLHCFLFYTGLFCFVSERTENRKNTPTNTFVGTEKKACVGRGEKRKSSRPIHTENYYATQIPNARSFRSSQASSFFLWHLSDKRSPHPRGGITIRQHIPS